MKVATCIWLKTDMMEAARFYTSLLPDSEILDHVRFDDMMSGAENANGVINITIGGAPFMLLQAGPYLEHNDMMSISVVTKDQAETDRLWDALTKDGGEESQCGWLHDKYGVSWQLNPEPVNAMLKSDNRAKKASMFEAMLPMKRLDIAALEKAFNAG